MIVYLDTSALVKRYLREDESDNVIALLNEAGHLFGSLVITQVEMAATFQRAVRMDIASSKMVSEIWGDFLNHWESVTHLNVSAGTIERACVIAWEHGLRGYDSLHLASALLWQESLGLTVTLATFDRDLWSAAKKAGLDSWPQELV